MAVRSLDLTGFLLFGEAVLGIEAELLGKMANLPLADSSASADPIAGHRWTARSMSSSPTDCTRTPGSSSRSNGRSTSQATTRLSPCG